LTFAAHCRWWTGNRTLEAVAPTKQLHEHGMKNIANLAHWMERFKGNEEFYALLEKFEQAVEHLADARERKRAAKDAYRIAIEDAALSEFARLSLLTEFRQAKYLYLAEKAGCILSRYALEDWLDQHAGGERKNSGKKKPKAP
jgi:hypothetical protein